MNYIDLYFINFKFDSLPRNFWFKALPDCYRPYSVPLSLTKLVAYILIGEFMKIPDFKLLSEYFVS